MKHREVHRVVRIANSSVMGASAVDIMSTLLAIAGCVQAVGMILGAVTDQRISWGSAILLTWGGHALAATWSLTMILAWAFVQVSRRQADPVDGAVWEVGGIILLVTVIGLFIAANLLHGGPDGRVFILMLCASSALNLTGRAVLLVKRVWFLRRAAKT